MYFPGRQVSPDNPLEVMMVAENSSSRKVILRMLGEPGCEGNPSQSQGKRISAVRGDLNTCIIKFCSHSAHLQAPFLCIMAPAGRRRPPGI